MEKWRKRRELVRRRLLRLLFLWATELTAKNTTSLPLSLLCLNHFLLKVQATRVKFLKTIFPLFFRWTITTLSSCFLEIDHVLVSTMCKSSLSLPPSFSLDFSFVVMILISWFLVAASSGYYKDVVAAFVSFPYSSFRLKPSYLVAGPITLEAYLNCGLHAIKYICVNLYNCVSFDFL